MSEQKKPLINLQGTGNYKRAVSEIVDDFLKIEDFHLDERIEEIDKKFEDLRATCKPLIKKLNPTRRK